MIPLILSTCLVIVTQNLSRNCERRGSARRFRALISRATTKDETIYRTTVGKLPQSPGAAAPSLLIVGSVVGLPAGEEAREEVLSGEFRSEILSLAMQHPVHDSYGRGDFE